MTQSRKSSHWPTPGVSREQRLGDEGLQRLEQQLKSGRPPSAQVLQQWVRRYGEAAEKLILEHGYPLPEKPQE